jgi:FkbM family methyltransferase
MVQANMDIVRLVHTGMIGIIRVLPTDAAVFAFRLFNFGFWKAGRIYKAKTYFGSTMFCNATDVLQMMILHFGCWEPTISRLVERLISPGDTVIDVGANIGYDTLLASHLVGPTGNVVSIEANPATFAAIQKHLSVNAVSNVRAVNIAVSAQPGTLTLYEEGIYNSGAVTTLASRGFRAFATVDGKPLHSVLTHKEVAAAKLIKVDVEGAESAVIASILDRLSDYSERMNLIVEISPTDDPTTWKALFDSLRNAGFSAYKIENMYRLEWYLKWRRPAPLEPLVSLPAELTDVLFTRSPPAELREAGIELA